MQPDLLLKPTNGTQLRLWAETAPQATGDAVTDIPTLTPFLPAPENANGCAVLICPGGGYTSLAIGHEGVDIGQWFASRGVAGFMLKYRISPYRKPVPMLDAKRAMRFLRYHAKAWDIDPNRIGIMGFSAGGHLASTIGTHFDAGMPGAPDVINRHGCRPDFMILGYPVISMKDGVTHEGSRIALLGDGAPSELIDFHSNELHVTADTPPAYIVHSSTDEAVKIENSRLFHQALQSKKVRSELVEFSTGDHGYGMAQHDPQLATWPDRCLVWMTAQGFMNRSQK